MTMLLSVYKQQILYRVRAESGLGSEEKPWICLEAEPGVGPEEDPGKGQWIENVNGEGRMGEERMVNWGYG